jgi:hypothetical protein
MASCIVQQHGSQTSAETPPFGERRLDFSACAGPCCSRFGKTGDCGVGYFQMVFFRFVPMNMDSWSSQE